MKTNVAGLNGFTVFAFWILYTQKWHNTEDTNCIPFKKQFRKVQKLFQLSSRQKPQQPLRRVQMEEKYGTFNQYWYGKYIYEKKVAWVGHMSQVMILKYK